MAFSRRNLPHQRFYICLGHIPHCDIFYHKKSSNTRLFAIFFAHSSKIFFLLCLFIISFYKFLYILWFFADGTQDTETKCRQCFRVKKSIDQTYYHNTPCRVFHKKQKMFTVRSFNKRQKTERNNISFFFLCFPKSQTIAFFFTASGMIRLSQNYFFYRFLYQSLMNLLVCS